MNSSALVRLVLAVTLGAMAAGCLASSAQGKEGAASAGPAATDLIEPNVGCQVLRRAMEDKCPSGANLVDCDNATSCGPTAAAWSFADVNSCATYVRQAPGCPEATRVVCSIGCTTVTQSPARK